MPGSKSCTIRAVLFGMLADGTTVIHNPLPSRDGLAALNAARAFGAQVTVDENANTWTVLGLNGRPNVPDNVIDTMNSGTTTSFVIGLCTLLTDGCAVITGDEQIRRRPWRHETAPTATARLLWYMAQSTAERATCPASTASTSPVCWPPARYCRQVSTWILRWRILWRHCTSSSRSTG